MIKLFIHKSPATYFSAFVNTHFSIPDDTYPAVATGYMVTRACRPCVPCFPALAPGYFHVLFASGSDWLMRFV